jgi:hypothetical protein
MAFFKEKFDAEGNFQKLKARFVPLGNYQDREVYDISKTAAPTPKLESVLSCLAHFAAERRSLYYGDVPSAYAHAIAEEQVFIRIQPELAKHLIAIAPDIYKSFQDNDGLVVQVKKALYGLLDSALLWYKTLSEELKKLAYQEHPLDSCIFDKITEDGTHITVIIYVDDLLIAGSNETIILHDVKYLSHLFGDMKVNKSSTTNYIGMHIHMHDGVVDISQNAYVQEILEEHFHIIRRLDQYSVQQMTICIMLMKTRQGYLLFDRSNFIQELLSYYSCLNDLVLT